MQFLVQERYFIAVLYIYIFFFLSFCPRVLRSFSVGEREEREVWFSWMLKNFFSDQNMHFFLADGLSGIGTLSDV